MRFGVAHKENPAGRAITKLLSSLELDDDQQALFIRPVGREEAAANTASTTYDKVMYHCAGIIPGARVVVATTGLIWEQKGQTHSPLRAHMESLDVLISEEAQQDMDLKSAFAPAVPRQPFFRLLLGDPRQSPDGVADNLREHRTLLLKAPIGLRAMHKWFMPHELPAVVCRLLKESAEIPMQELTQAAQEAGNKALGSRWNTCEDCPSPTPAGASLQAANQELSRLNFDTPRRTHSRSRVCPHTAWTCFHKLIERMKGLHFQDVTPEEGKRYRHNSESEANSPYIIVGTYDGVCTSNTFSALPHTPKVAGG